MNEKLTPPCRCGLYHFPHRRAWQCADRELEQELDRGLDDLADEQMRDNVSRARDLNRSWP